MHLIKPMPTILLRWKFKQNTYKYVIEQEQYRQEISKFIDLSSETFVNAQNNGTLNDSVWCIIEQNCRSSDTY